jgi:hypothetical protein
MVAIGADEKQKLYILLGLAGVLALVVIFVIKPFGGGSEPEAVAVSTAPPVAATASAPGAVPPGAPPGAVPPDAAGAAAGAPAATAGVGATPQLIAAEKFRSDPFTPYYAPVVVPPPPPPPPTPAPPIPLPPPPVAVPQPDESVGGGLAPAPIIPGIGGGGISVLGRGGSSGSTLRINLPPVTIPQFAARTSPRIVNPGGRVGSAPERPAATRSGDKRIAGVIIGNSVRAVIEINDGTQTVTRIVQPGDELEDLNLRILRIERVTEDNVTTTRMTVLENGQERYFDLRPSPNPIASTLPGGEPGMDGPPGGFPGRGFPGGGGFRPNDPNRIATD